MIVSQTPLRVSFAGGGSDFPEFYLRHGGAVVSTAIDRYLYVVVKERFDKKIRVAYTRTEIVDHPDELQHDLVRESLKLSGITSGIEICTMADIPSEGSGLGSSSSLTVGLLNALYAYAGKPRTAEILAQDACKIELEVLGKPMGKQDAYIAAYGGIRMFRFHTSGEVETEELGLSPTSRRWLEENMLLFFSGRTRQAQDILQRQKENINACSGALCSLRDLAWDLRACLCNGLGPTVGEILHKGWEVKRSLAEGISDRELDAIYLRAMEAGAIGGKVTGAGGGGFFLLHCPPEKRELVRKALPELSEMTFRLEASGSKTLLHF